MTDQTPWPTLPPLEPGHDVSTTRLPPAQPTSPNAYPASGQNPYGQPTAPHPYAAPTAPHPYAAPTAPHPYAQPTAPSQAIATTGFGAVQGYQAQPTYAYANPYPVLAPPRTNGLAVASMIMGILGLLVSWFTVGIPSILAVVFGHISLNQIRHSSNTGGRGMAIGGLVTGYVGVAGGLLLLVVFLGLAATGA